MNKDIYVFIEQREGVIQKVSLELLSKARELAEDLNEKVVAVLLGDKVTGLAEGLGKYGASTVLVVDSPLLSNYTTEPYAKALTYIIKAYQPNIVLYGATSIGRDLAPRVAGRIHTGLTADCTRLDISGTKYQEFLRKTTSLGESVISEVDTKDKNLKMTRPAFGGNIMATIICPNYRPQMATVRPGVIALGDVTETTHTDIIVVDPSLSKKDLNVEVVEILADAKKDVDITEAKVLVSGGRGVGGPEGYNILRALAKELEGEVSSSRIGVDSGWIEKSRQVGQTGKTVRPNVYFACGISGAIQHMAGMENSGCIIAINKDEHCPMMKQADLGIVGDLKVIIPKLTAALRQYKAEN